jgi:hypothetical protein
MRLSRRAFLVGAPVAAASVAALARPGQVGEAASTSTPVLIAESSTDAQRITRQVRRALGVNEVAVLVTQSDWRVFVPQGSVWWLNGVAQATQPR